MARMTSFDAARRAALAQDRLDAWLDVARRAEDSADAQKSKSWRTRYLNQAEYAYGLADRAALDLEKWSDLAEELAQEEQRKEEEREKRRQKRRKKKEPPPSPPPRKRYAYILKVSYEPGRKKQDRHHAVWWDVRFRKIDGSRATQAELEYAVRRIHLGEIPRGWEVLAIAWDRGVRDGGDPSREAGSQKELEAAMGQLGATLDSRGGMTWQDRDNEYSGGNYTVGEEEEE